MSENYWNGYSKFWKKRNLENNNSKSSENHKKYNYIGILDYKSEQELLNPVNGFIHKNRKSRITPVEEVSIEMIDDMLVINADKE